MQPIFHGRNLVGTRETCVPHFFRRGGHNMPCPPHFSLRVLFREVSKLNVTFVTFCVKSFSGEMLHIAMLMLK